MSPTRKCAHCGFRLASNQRKFCGKACKEEFNFRRRSNGRTCQQCEAELVGYQRAVCSVRCKNALNYRRRAERTGRERKSRLPGVGRFETRGQCEFCDQTLCGQRRRWCSELCKTRWYHEQRAQPGYRMRERSRRSVEPTSLQAGSSRERRGSQPRVRRRRAFTPGQDLSRERIREAAKRYPSILQDWTADMVTEETMLRLAKKLEKQNRKKSVASS